MVVRSRPGRRSDIVPRRCRRRSGRRRLPPHHRHPVATPAGSWRPRSPSGPRRPARPASSTTRMTRTWCWAAAASSGTTGRGADMPEIGPSLVLAILLGIFWTAAAVLVRGVAGARLPFLLLLAITGAWAGDAIGGRVGGPFDLLRTGDHRTDER